MRRLLLVVALAIPLGGAMPAQGSDAQLRFVMHRMIEKVGYITKRTTRAMPRDPAAGARWAARIARAARRAAHVLSHLQPSTHTGAVSRHGAIQGLRDLRISGRLFLLSLNTDCACRASRYAEQALKRELRGLGRLILAWARLLRA